MISCGSQLAVTVDNMQDFPEAFHSLSLELIGSAYGSQFNNTSKYHAAINFLLASDILRMFRLNFRRHRHHRAETRKMPTRNALVKLFLIS